MHVRLNFLLALATSASANWLATELYSDGVHNAPPRNLNTCLEADRYLDGDILLGWSFPSGVPLSTVDKTDDGMLTLKRPDGSTYVPCVLPSAENGYAPISCSMTVDAGDTLTLEADPTYEVQEGTRARAERLYCSRPT